MNETELAKKRMSLLCQMLDENEINYKVNNKNLCVSLTFDCENIKELDVLFIFDDDGYGVNIRSYGVAKFSETQLPAAYKYCNYLNDRYRWTRFCVDSDGDLTCGIDIIAYDETLKKVCRELLYRFVTIIDEAYGTLMN